MKNVFYTIFIIDAPENPFFICVNRAFSCQLRKTQFYDAVKPAYEKLC